MNRGMRVGIGGFTSNIGKTTLVCELLRLFPGWEAIKTTRGHYRSCGKDPRACCVSHLLADTAVVRSGWNDTYESGKDTGRYWDAGAANVHWVIAMDSQVEAGIKEALARVAGPGVFIEGNSFSDFVDTDLFIMVARPESYKAKASARRMLKKSSVIYLGKTTDQSRFLNKLQRSFGDDLSRLQCYTSTDITQLAARIRQLASPELFENVAGR